MAKLIVFFQMTGISSDKYPNESFMPSNDNTNKQISTAP